jgi:hypothetical protein
VSELLRTLVSTLIVTAHELPGNIERLVETEAFEVNRVIVANRK